MICFLEELFNNGDLSFGSEDDFSDDADFSDSSLVLEGGEGFIGGSLDVNGVDGTLDDTLDNGLFDDAVSDFDKNYNDSSQVSFTGKYSQQEIDKFQRDVDTANSLRQSWQNKVNDLNEKLSLNNTKEHRAKGDYDNILRKLQKAKEQLSNAKSELKNAQIKLNDATG